MFTDNGIPGNDINSHTLDKSKSVSIKLANFVTNNLHAPITVKFKVLKSCVTATILYACETWSYSNLARIEALHRRAIKTCTKMMQNTPNDIVYIETGSSPLSCTVYKRQYRFWSKIKQDLEQNNDSSITKLYNAAIPANLPFIKHYITLHEKFANEEECFNFYRDQAYTEVRSLIHAKSLTDNGGIYGTCLQINPNLIRPLFYKDYLISESDRLLLTKYRTGSHYLNVQKGRLINIQRSDRLCLCNSGVQDLHHIIFQCIVTQSIRDNNFACSNLEEFFSDIITAPLLLRILEELLKLR